VGFVVGLRHLRLIAACASLSVCASPAIAQVGAGQPGAQPPRQELNPAQALPPPRTPARANEDLLGAPLPGPCPLGQSSLRFTLTAVDFAGAFKLRPRTLESTYAADVGQEIGLAEVCRIRDRAGQILFRQGILARVEIPQQRIENGRLQLSVIEAHVVSVQVHGDAGPAQDKVETYLDRLRGMRPFDIRKAQRYLLLASDLPGVRVSASLRPAAEGSGAVDLIVFVSRKPVDAVANVQNEGSYALGPGGGVTRVDFNGFTRFGERTSLVAYSTLDNAEQRVFELLSEGRLGGDGLTVRGSGSYGLSAPGGDLAPLRLEGRSLVVDGTLSYPLIRARRRNLNLAVGFDLIDQTTAFSQGGLLNEDHLRVFFAHADADQRWGKIADWFPAGLFGANMDVRRGIDGLGSSVPGEAYLSRIGGRPDSFVVRGDAHLELAFLDKLNGRFVFSGQYSGTPLLAYEQFAVGNLTIGRGYDPSALTGDEGAAGSVELHAGPFAPPTAWKAPIGLSVSAFGFYDVAAVFARAVGGTDRTVHSAGAGLDFELTPRAKLDVTYAYPFDKTSEFSLTPPSPRLLVSLTTSFL
jgi:hemolysin activation/secretion protein